MAKTSKKAAQVVPFSLSRIQTLEFAILDRYYSENEEVQVSQAFNFGVDPETMEVGIASRYEFFQTAPFLLIEVRCTFTIFPEVWKKWMDAESGVFILPKDIATHMAMLCVGTTRGVLHAKTESTYFNRFVLPTWNLSEVIDQDWVVTLVEEPESD